MKNIILLLCVITCISMGCQQNTVTQQEVDTAVSGKITISVDETVLPIAQAEADIFQHQYPKAHLNLRQRSEADCIQDLFNDSCKMIFIGRALTDKEKAVFQGQTLDPPHIKVATDAIAILVNPKNRDTTLNMQQIIDILRGSTTKWQQLNSNISSDLTLVFDNANSGTVNYLMGLAGVSTLPKNAYAAKSNLEAVNYVASHENAIGVIGWSWISDSDDPTTQQYLAKTRLVSVAPTGSKDYCKPYQLNLAEGKYPLSRPVYMIQRERRSGLAAGFMTFVYNEIGQTIILKAGLLPANAAERNLEIKTKPMGKVGN